MLLKKKLQQVAVKITCLTMIIIKKKWVHRNFL